MEKVSLSAEDVKGMKTCTVKIEAVN